MRHHLALVLASVFLFTSPLPADEPVGPPAYDGVARESLSIPVRDGILLAADVFRPTHDGRTATDPLPVIWTLQRYHRASMRDGELVTIIQSRYPWLADVVRHGYVAAIVDARGTGASQGVRPVELGADDARDAHDVTEWLAARPWTTADVGMYGRSFRGMTQYLAAGARPPHLRAIFPEMAMFDAFDTAYRQGVPLRMFEAWGAVVGRLDGFPGLPTEDDPEGANLAGWLERRKAENMDVAAFAARTTRPEVTDPTTGVAWSDVSPSRFVESIRGSGVAVHHLAGWLDVWVDDAIAWFEALEGSVPQKLTIGPWEHAQRDDALLADAHVRWYDHWLQDRQLQGEESGLLDEPAVRYATSNLAGDVRWTASPSWPPTGLETRTLHLAGDAAAGRGVLAMAPEADPMTTSRAADYEATTGETSRWGRSVGRSFRYPDLAPNDARGFVWQTAPLERPTTVTGAVVARLRISSTAPDADLFVYLEEVDLGVSHYVTEGMARARVATPGASLDEAPAEVEVRLLATSWTFTPGHRIRLTLTLADRDNARGLTYDPAPLIHVHSGGEEPSRLTLPVEETAP